MFYALHRLANGPNLAMISGSSSLLVHQSWTAPFRH
jgi:hypothetical protein